MTTPPAHTPLTLKFALVLASVIVFAVAAVFFFWVDTITIKTDLGIVAAGLAALAAASLFP